MDQDKRLSSRHHWVLREGFPSGIKNSGYWLHYIVRYSKLITGCFVKAFHRALKILVIDFTTSSGIPSSITESSGNKSFSWVPIASQWTIDQKCCYGKTQATTMNEPMVQWFGCIDTLLSQTHSLETCSWRSFERLYWPSFHNISVRLLKKYWRLTLIWMLPSLANHCILWRWGSIETNDDQCDAKRVFPMLDIHLVWLGSFSAWLSFLECSLWEHWLWEVSNNFLYCEIILKH